MSAGIEKIDGLTYMVAEVDASKASSYRKLYFHLKEMFQFPETSSSAYGDVLLDYMTDLGWLRKKNFKLVVRNMKKTAKLDPKTGTDFRDSLEHIREYWENKKARNGRDWEDNFIIEFTD